MEGKNITIEWRRGVGTQEETRLQAIDLVASKVDLIVSFGSPATRAALDTGATPVVFLVGDPVGAGFAVSLARPGGKGTGVSTQTTELNRKRLEILRQLSPRAQRFLYLGNYSNPIAARDLAEMEKGARALGIKLVSLSAQNSAEIEVELQAIRQRSGDAVVVSADTTLLVNKAKIASAIREAKLPAIFPFREYHEVGALMSYSPNMDETMYRLATYVDRILRGANPAEQPIEQISTYELIIDLRIAREMRIPVPQELLLRANDVIR